MYVCIVEPYVYLIVSTSIRIIVFTVAIRSAISIAIAIAIAIRIAVITILSVLQQYQFQYAFVLFNFQVKLWRRSGSQFQPLWRHLMQSPLLRFLKLLAQLHQSPASMARCQQSSQVQMAPQEHISTLFYLFL